MIAFLLAWAPPAHAQDAGIEFFERKVRPLLVEHCYGCHAQSAKKVRGGLLLDSRAGLRKGGESGPSLDPAHPDKSLLLKAVRYTDDGLKMPPVGKLPASAIADLEAWVKMGAPDPRAEPVVRTSARAWPDVLRERRGWWSLQPVRASAVPLPRDRAWSADAIDRFLLAKLEEKGLKPNPDATPATLARRLSLVLTGLPPSPEQVRTFERACAEEKPASARARLVDDLLASPHFGEHWARHWMDVVRFTETHGNEWNYEVHHAWRYRDYLIRAFNTDVPYDLFVREHLAGDLISRPRWNTRENYNESVIGTAFYRFGEVNHDDCISLPQIGYDLADNQIDTLSKAFQGLTIACARCHDHKIDAVSMRDYYGLLGVLRSARQVSHTIDGPEVNAAARQSIHKVKEPIRGELADAWLSEISAARLEKALAGATEPGLPWEHPLVLWQRVGAARAKEGLTLADAWRKVTDEARAEAKARAADRGAVVVADFRHGAWPDWQVGGQGLGARPTPSGDFVVAADGERALRAILPAGAFTHVVSDKLNGTLRSPVLAAGKKYISFEVMGERSSAVRLVSNNCQLNYKNFRALTSGALRWITFEVPDEAASLRVYAELMTMFDNPKFPDQLGQLGGDTMNYRIPWEKAAANPRSYFGVTRVVRHDVPTPPRDALGTTLAFAAEPAPATISELAQLMALRAKAAIHAWKAGRAGDDDARWLQALLELGALTNSAKLTPRLKTLITEYRKLDAALELPRVVPGLADCGPGFEQALFTRGDCGRPGETVPRRYLEVLRPAPLASKGSGRAELADIIAARGNPLTARVMVNRVWHHLFGTGLVRSVDDFGQVGEPPSHPELLDFLATRFMDEGWSIKRLIRAIVLTRAFALAHVPSSEALDIDPENRLLARYPARRLDAEPIRDSILSASGRLERTLYGMSIPACRESDNEYRRLFRGPLDGNGRRSIYIKVTLMEAPRFLEAFNLPGGKVTQGRRDVTHVPAQALAMLNDPFVRQQAEVWARRLLQRGHGSSAARVDDMFQTALNRPPRPDERERFVRFALDVAELHQVAPEAVLASARVWRDVAHALFNLNEFITIP